MNEEIAAIMTRVETHRAEVRRVKATIQEVVAETMQLSGVGGMWAKLTGKYERQVEDAERVVLTLRAELAEHERKLQTAERELAGARERAERAERAERPTAPAEDAPRPDTPEAQLAADLDAFQACLEKVRRTGERVAERAATAGPLRERPRPPRGLGRSRGRDVGRDFAKAFNRSTDTGLGSVGMQWETQVDEAEGLADTLGVFLALPRQTQAAGSHLRGAATAHPQSHAARQSMVVREVTIFATMVQQSTKDIDELLGDVATARTLLERGEVDGARQALTGAGRSDGPAAAGGDARAQLASQWKELFGIAKVLDRVASPGTRTSDLLGPMSRWNQQATATRAFAEAHGLQPIPPVNQGGDLMGFVDGLRAMLPALQAEVDALES